jgi:hypothetical protein
MPRQFQFHKDHDHPMGEWIWVFATSLGQDCNKGSAKVARLHFRASPSVSCGPTGGAYALAAWASKHQLLPVEQIKVYVDEFLDYARAHPDKNFFVTPIACAAGQHPPSTMAALFKDASLNCSLPASWMPFLVAPPSTADSHRGPQI